MWFPESEICGPLLCVCVLLVGCGGGKMGLYWSLPESEVCGPLLCVCVLLVGCGVGVGANKVGMYW